MSAKLDGIKIGNEIAKNKGGKLITTKYINIFIKMLWECKKEHQWKVALHYVKNKNYWCPKCGIERGADKRRLQNGPEIAKQKAMERGGKCLSTEYINNHTKMLWKCNKGHEWKANFSKIVGENQWCPRCSVENAKQKTKLQNGLELAQQKANSMGGECLNTDYENDHAKIMWKCNKNHIWGARFSDVVRKGSWCPDCAQSIRSRSLDNSYTLTHWKTEEELVCTASWEKRVVEYLNKNKINFRWQPRSFLMPDGRKYYPDMYLFSTKKWVEIKGYFWGRSKEKWDWFHKEKPNSELWNEEKLKEMEIL